MEDHRNVQSFSVAMGWNPSNGDTEKRLKMMM
jgi:hypothetical protein